MFQALNLTRQFHQLVIWLFFSNAWAWLLAPICWLGLKIYNYQTSKDPWQICDHFVLLHGPLGHEETSSQTLEFGWWEALGVRAAARNRYKYVLFDIEIQRRSSGWSPGGWLGVRCPGPSGFVSIFEGLLRGMRPCVVFISCRSFCWATL